MIEQNDVILNGLFLGLGIILGMLYEGRRYRAALVRLEAESVAREVALQQLSESIEYLREELDEIQADLEASR